VRNDDPEAVSVRRTRPLMALTSELVARCRRLEPDPGPEPKRHYFSEIEYDASARTLLEAKPPGPLRIFAYGSLIWKPACESVEQTAFAWDRAFSLELRRWRGAPQQPRLMMALEHDGRCDGITCRLPDASETEQLGQQLRREVSGPEGLRAIHWITLDACGVRLRRLAFWVGPASLEGAGRRCRSVASHRCWRAPAGISVPAA
jgi:cation transport protein ChaC